MRRFILLGSLTVVSLSLFASCGGQTDSASSDAPSAQGGSAGTTGASSGGSSGKAQGGTTSSGASGGGSGAGATTGGSGSAGATSSGTLPCDVQDFFEGRCQACHGPSPKFGAPMSLVTRDDLLVPSLGNPALTVGQMIPIRLKDKKKPMPQPPYAAASPDEIALMEAYVGAGMPPGPATCGQAGAGGSGQGGQSAGGANQGGSSQAGAGGSSGNQSGGQAGSAQGGSSGNQSGGQGGTSQGGTNQGGTSQGGTSQGGTNQGGSGGYDLGCDPDVVVAPTSAWQMPAETADQYACYGFDIPVSDLKRQITAIAPAIDNETIVHHLLVLLADSSQPSAATPCSALPPYQWKLLYAWGPGAPSMKLPQEAGFPIEAGETAHVVMQVHYSNLKHLDGQSDSSGVKLCTTKDLRPNDADVMALGSTSFSIPAHAKKTIDCTTGTSLLPGPVTVFQAWPHMHLLGTALHSKVVHKDGTEADLGGSDSYSFYNQITYPVDVPVTPGDKLLTSCSWENTSDMSVSFGEATSDEMCFNFLSYYPKITTPQWSWIVPASLLASCK